MLENAAMQSLFSENSTRFRTMEAAHQNIQNKSREITKLMQRPSSGVGNYRNSGPDKRLCRVTVALLRPPSRLETGEEILR